MTESDAPRPGTTAESLAKLQPSFPAIADYRHGDFPTFRELINQKYPDVDIQHVHHAGNSSGVVDGAAAILLASDEYAKAHGMTPRARVVSVVCAGVAPRIMGIGPAPATKKLLEKTGRSLSDIDLIELNEAFASQGLAVLRQLGLPDDAEHVNPHGGAISLGHPLGMSGARLAMTAVSALEVRGGKRAIATMCIGVGQGIAGLIERV